MAERYDLVLVGSGFAAGFFLAEYLRGAPPTARVLVLERGPLRPHAAQVQVRHQALAEGHQTFVNQTPAKAWNYSPLFGGGSNCWWGNTPRMLPEDFALRTRFGSGVDWPLGYDDLEADYLAIERAMAISGPAEGPTPRSAPYPQPPHTFSQPDEVLARAHPGEFFAMATARPTQATGGRPACCATGVCEVCPRNAKWTVLNGLQAPFRDPRVTVTLGARVDLVEHAGGVATGVRATTPRGELRAEGELVALAANALFNPYILLASGLDQGGCGRGLCEQVGVTVEVDLDGLDNFQGSTSSVGHGLMLYRGVDRARRAGALMETMNVPKLRDLRGRWRQYLEVRFVFEDEPQAESTVTVDPRTPGKPVVHYAGPSAWTRAGLAALPQDAARVLGALPIEDLRVPSEPDPTESHILGTTPMGRDPATSVVDPDLRHHQVRNLVVLGSSTFPTCPPANPTLTLSALARRAARRLRG